MATKKSSKKQEVNLASVAENLGKTDIAAEVQKVVTKLSSDAGLLEKFKTNAMSVVKKILPAIKDKNILNSIIEAVKAKLNIGNLIGGLAGGKTDGKDGKDGGILGGLTGLFGGK